MGFDSFNPFLASDPTHCDIAPTPPPRSNTHSFKTPCFKSTFVGNSSNAGGQCVYACVCGWAAVCVGGRAYAPASRGARGPTARPLAARRRPPGWPSAETRGLRLHAPTSKGQGGGNRIAPRGRGKTGLLRSSGDRSIGRPSSKHGGEPFGRMPERVCVQRLPKYRWHGWPSRMIS